MDVSSGRKPRLIVVMGVSGSGKSTVGPLVAAAAHVPFVDGDDYHDARSIEHMRQGVPLTDADRRPWLDRLHAVLVAHADAGVVLACSALKPDYRDRLRGDVYGVVFVALVVGRTELTQRLARRAAHFAGPALLASQLADADLEGTIRVDGERPPGEVAAAIVAALEHPSEA